MSFLTLAVIVLGLVFGYWGVAGLFKNKPPGDASPNPGAGSAPPTPAPQGAPAQRWYQVLGVSPSASPDEIKAAYRQMMSQYHPDKVSTLGVELQALAERKSKDIGAAYREGMNASGAPV